MAASLTNMAHLNIQYYALDHVTIGPWWDFHNFASPFTRLFYIFDGEAVIRHQYATVKLQAGQLVLAPPFLPVTYSCHKRCENVFIIFTCQMERGTELFSLPFSRYEVTGFPLAETYAKRLVFLNPCMKLHEVDPAHPQYNAYLWHAEQNRPDTAAQLETQGLLRLLLAPFLNYIDSGHATLQPHRLHKVLHYIDRHLDQPLTLKSLSEVGNLHPTYLSDLFARIVGMRPITYINQKRIEKAQLALISTNQSVKRVAYEVGFRDANYFSRLFKKQIGVSPLAYRASHW